MSSDERKRIDDNWKRRNYAMGAGFGALLGLLSAYLFTREAENTGEDDERPDLAPTALIGLALSVLGIVRQIAEAGRKKKKDK